VSSVAADRPARARLGCWPYDDRVAHLVLLDHHMVPNATDVAGWIDDAKRSGATTVRTGALFPNATAAFLDAGFRVADTLALLICELGDRRRNVEPPAERSRIRVRRLRPAMLADAAAIDRRAFSAPWANDVAALGDIMTATPYHRARSVHLDGRMVAFSISGRAGSAGYVQRLAVDPSARRRGFATLLVDDALRWMQRRGVERAMVNTAVDNERALALYRSASFEEQPGSLLILERTLR
jgi:ribosomal protein S18 acetylase RimI-like enzyme